MSSLAFLIALASQSSPSGADYSLRFEMRPSGDPQIAVWLEDTRGTFVDTLMVTRLTGTFGLGNRPGRSDFGGGFLWPYGRRENVLPVWAHRRGYLYPRIVFQDCREDSLGWHERDSSEEPYYCRPLSAPEQAAEAAKDPSVDTISCPTTRFSSDKGIPMTKVDRSLPLCDELFSRYDSTSSLYPPRNDLQRVDPNRDWDGLGGFESMNDLDAISQPTPPSGQLYRRTIRLPAGLADGEYTLWVEVNQAFDPNGSHDYDFFIDPMLSGYGVRVIGQPSVVWKVPVRIGPEASSAFSSSYAGYGSSTGQEGTLTAPDGTITVGVEGTGAGRLLPIQGEANTTYQIRADVLPSTAGGGSSGGGDACTSPAAPRSLTQTFVDWRGVDVLVEMAAAADNMIYDVRYAEGHDAIQNQGDYLAAVPGLLLEPGSTTSMAIRIPLSRDQWDYTLAIRATNDCGDVSEIVTLNVTTERREYQDIDACFVATAAHGARYADEVVALRNFRDEVLLPTEAGLAAVELYYYVSPPLAGFIRDHAPLRAATRWALSPLVWAAEQF